jgi:hypothetical protein
VKSHSAILMMALLLAGCGEPQQEAFDFGQPYAQVAVLPAADNQSFRRFETDSFVILSQAGDRWNTGAGPTLEGFRKDFESAFSKWGVKLTAPTEKMTWVCFADYDGFDRYARREDKIDSSWTSGYYSPRTNRVAVVDPKVRRTVRPAGRTAAQDADSGQVAAAIAEFDMARLRHEAAHQLAFNCGLQKRGVEYPFWLSEGLATNFEAEDSAAHGDSVRASRLRELARRGNLMPLEDLIVLTRPAGDAAEIWAQYLQAWGLFRMLVQNHPDQMRKYLANLASMSPGRRSREAIAAEFTTAFGTVESVQGQWVRFANSPEPGRLLK